MRRLMVGEEAGFSDSSPQSGGQAAIVDPQVTATQTAPEQSTGNQNIEVNLRIAKLGIKGGKL